MKNLHLDLVRVTEAGAISAAEWVGRGNKEEADRAATEAMRNRLDKIDFRAEIAIGEGKKDESYGLFEGERVGNSSAMLVYELAIDPIEGTTPTANGGYEAMSVIALGTKDSFYKTDCFYMKKLAVGPEIGDKVSLNYPLRFNLTTAAMALNKPVSHVTVCVLDRPRHKPLIDELWKLGCRLKFISDCDVSAGIATCEPDSGIDMYISVGGSPEAVITAAAMKSMGGFFQASLVDGNYKAIGDILEIEDLAKGDVIFSGTGITDGKLLKGVRFTSEGVTTHSITMRSESGTVRRIETRHGN